MLEQANDCKGGIHLVKYLDIQERVEFIEKINEILDSWNGTVETGPEILQEIQEHLETLE